MTPEQANAIAQQIVAEVYDFTESAILDARTYEFPIHRIHGLIAAHNVDDSDEAYQRLAKVVLRAVRRQMRVHHSEDTANEEEDA